MHLPFIDSIHSTLFSHRKPLPGILAGGLLAVLVGVAGCGAGDAPDDTNGMSSGTSASAVDAGTASQPSDAVTRLSTMDVNALLDPAMPNNGGVNAGNQVVDVRSAADYAAGHIPGAVHLETAGLRAMVDGVPGQVVARSVAQAAFEAAGIDSSAHLIVVGTQNDTNTSRALWTLAYYGAGAGLSLLDGGHQAWMADAMSLSTDDATSMRPYTGVDTREDLRVDKQWVLDHLGDANVAIFDVRTPGEYQSGHIPGAINANWTDNLGSNGLFNNDAMIMAHHQNPTASTLVVYCQSGARASVGWTLLRSVGYQDVRLYDGSWNEWGNDSTTPKETGSGG